MICSHNHNDDGGDMNTVKGFGLASMTVIALVLSACSGATRSQEEANGSRIAAAALTDAPRPTRVCSFPNYAEGTENTEANEPTFFFNPTALLQQLDRPTARQIALATDDDGNLITNQ